MKATIFLIIITTVCALAEHVEFFGAACYVSKYNDHMTKDLEWTTRLLTYPGYTASLVGHLQRFPSIQKALDLCKCYSNSRDQYVCKMVLLIEDGDYEEVLSVRSDVDNLYMMSMSFFEYMLGSGDSYGNVRVFGHGHLFGKANLGAEKVLFLSNKNGTDAR